MSHLLKVFCALTLASLSPVAAQEGTPATAAPIRFHHLGADDGLTQPDVHAITQDRLGFLWIGTEDGLYRYDGDRLRSFRPVPFDTTSIGGSWIVGIAPDGDGGLWVAAEDAGLNRYDARTETFRRRPGEVAPWTESRRHDLWTMLRARDGTLWLGTRGEGALRVDPKTGATRRFRDDPGAETDLGDDHVNAIAEGADGSIWIGLGDGGLARFDVSTDEIEHFRHDPSDSTTIPSDGVHALRVTHDGVLWVGTDRGLARWDDRSGAFQMVSGVPSTRSITVLLEDADDSLWIGSDVGLDHYDPTTSAVQSFRHDPTDLSSLGSGTVQSLYLDRSDVLWIGTESGLSYVARGDVQFPGVVHRLGAESGLSAPGVWEFYKEPDGTVWVGTEAGLDRIDATTGEITNYRHDPSDPASLAPGWVLTLHEDRRGDFWVGVRRTADEFGGLHRFDRATGRVVERFVHDPDDPASFPSDNPWNLFEDSAGRFWVLSGNDCPTILDRDARTFETLCADTADPKTPGDNAIKWVQEAPAGVLWFATWGAGLDRYDTRTGDWRHYRHDPSDPNTPADDTIMSLHLADDGMLWLGTYGAGVSQLDPATETFTHYNTSNSDLPNDVVYGIESDAAGHVWFSSNLGLTRFEPASGRFQTFGLEHGLQDLEFNVASYRAPDGELFFGGIRGFNRFTPADIVVDGPPPAVVLTGLSVRGEPVSVGAPGSPLEVALPYAETLVLAGDEGDIELSFAALDFASPGSNRYRYRLVGYDDWHEAGRTRTATYTNLDPGTYVFEVQAATSAGDWGAEPATLTIVVRPAWWQTVWARLGYLLLGVGAVGAGLGWQRRRRELNDRLEREHLEAEKLRELDLAKSRFFANVSHEFRTPLTLTLGPLDDVLDDTHGPVPEAVRGQLSLARRNARRVLDLVNQILDVARLEAGRTRLRAREIDLGAFVAEVADAFRPLAERSAMTYEVLRPDLPVRVWADPAQLEKAVVNLISNAVKFTPSGGTVRVSVEADAEAARIAVRDSGVGIAEADLPYVFDRFHRADESATQPGTGIGLALVREIADLHGGAVRAESEEGFGSTFTLSLPLGRDHLDPDDIDASPEAWAPRVPDLDRLGARGDGSAQSVDDPEAAGEAGDRPTVLVVEDHAEVRAYVRRHLEPTYRVIEAADGEAGLQAARMHLPDLVVSDVMMPKLDGLGLCRALKADPATDYLPVVLLTAKAEHEDRLDGLREHADAYLVKPFDPAELRLRIEALIADRMRLRERFRREGLAIVTGDGADVPALLPTPVEAASVDDAFLGEVREAIEANLTDDTFSVRRLAEAVGVSRGHLHRQLTTLARQTPSEAIRTMRLERAKQLLAARAGTVSEVAYAVGFKSVSHFSTAFSEFAGCAPSAYRAEA